MCISESGVREPGNQDRFFFFQLILFCTEIFSVAGKGWPLTLRSPPLPASRAQGRDVAGTCDLVLPKLVVFVRLLQGLDGRVVDLSKPLQHHWGQRRVKG